MKLNEVVRSVTMVVLTFPAQLICISKTKKQHNKNEKNIPTPQS